MTNMRILVLTLPLHKNYGGILQNYALCTILSRKGCQVESIKWEERKFSLPWYKKPFVYLKRFIKGGEVFYEERMRSEYPIIVSELNKFINKNIPYTSTCFSSPQIARKYIRKSNIEAIVFGSDQIWRKEYKKSSFWNRPFSKKSFPSLMHYYGDFLNEMSIKRIAYAASFGVDYQEYNIKESREAKMNINKFSAVSVREDSAVKLAKEIYCWEKHIERVLDPTLLLSQNDYDELIYAADSQAPIGNIFLYILDQSQIVSNIASEAIKQSRYTPYSITLSDKADNSIKTLPSIEQWLRNIRDSKFVITDSFHGVVFSILYNRPFVALGNKKRGNARFESLLSLFGLKDRMCYSVEEVNRCMSSDIDWSNVNHILNSERDKSLTFINNNIIR